MSQRHRPHHGAAPIDPDQDGHSEPGGQADSEAVRERDMPGNPLGPDAPDKPRGATRQDGELEDAHRN